MFYVAVHVHIHSDGFKTHRYPKTRKPTPFNICIIIIPL